MSPQCIRAKHNIVTVDAKAVAHFGKKRSAR